MKIHYYLLASLLLAVPAFSAVVGVGQTAPYQCWATDNSTQYCLSKNPTAIQVLLYNAGWCPDCNQEFTDLSKGVGQFDGKGVIFISLSANGFDNASPPDATFLAQWRARFNLPASFIVAASPNDAGMTYFNPPYYIPAVVIIDQNGTVVYEAVEPGADVIFDQVNSLLNQKHR